MTFITCPKCGYKYNDELIKYCPICGSKYNKICIDSDPKNFKIECYSFKIDSYNNLLFGKND